MNPDFLDLLPGDEKNKIIDLLKPCIKLSFQAVADLPLTASRLGGCGYWPRSMPYPRSRTSGKPLSLLAQINFAEMPPLEDFPKSGLLSFYIIGADDDFEELWGLSYENPVDDNGFRVMYFPDHREESYSEAEQAAIFKEEGYREVFLPVHSYSGAAVKMNGRPGRSHPLTDCKEAEEIYGGQFYYDYYADLLGEDSAAFKKLTEAFGSQSHLIGGYPYFTQNDPRLANDPEGEFDTLLLQLDIDGDQDGGWSLMWGDAGVGNFFINRQSLKNLDFSRVLYNWDCC